MIFFKKTFNASLLLLTLLSGSVLADIAVIVNLDNANTVSSTEIKRIYLGKLKTFNDGNQIIALNQQNSVSDEFNQKALNVSDSQIKAYWAKMIFSGKGSPMKNAADDNEVIRLVKNGQNVLGYIDSSKVTSEVKVVARF